jgi:replicative superfamily II helicase
MGRASLDGKFDHASVCMMLQQFLDEWYFRVLHAQVANDMDRYQALDIALQMIELHLEVSFPPDARQRLLQTDDETEMVQQLVSLMSMESRETFEHFALQLQLIVASTTRVRRALDLDDWDAVAVSMEAADQTGITQQILKQAVVEAGVEVAELKGRQESWAKNTEFRINRLARMEHDAKNAERELIQIEAQLGGFGGSQNAKSKKALMGVANQNDKALCQTIFSSWLQWIVKARSEKRLRLLTARTHPA